MLDAGAKPLSTSIVARASKDAQYHRQKLLPVIMIIKRNDLIFAVRTTAASLIALYIAFLMNMDDPKWAAMTVWIVAQSSRAMSVSKSIYRLMGTAIGVVVAVLLTAIFIQTPTLFLLVLAGWIGLCTALSTGLRNFRSYGAVLAGYTAAIVAIDSLSDPENVFEIAVSRLIYIALGIVTEAIITWLFSTDNPFEEARAQLGKFMRQTAKLCAEMLGGEAGTGALQTAYRNAIAFDTAIEYKAASSVTVRRSVGYLRQAMVVTLQQASAVRAILEMPSQTTSGDPLLLEAKNAMAQIADGDETVDLEALREKIMRTAEEETSGNTDLTSGRLMFLYRLRSMLGFQEQALAIEAELDTAHPKANRVRLSYHVDHTAAFINGIRAFVALAAASAIWIFTAWPSGPGFVIVVGVVNALFATRPNPVASGTEFLKGSAIAAIVAAIMNFGVLPVIWGFLPFTIVIAPVLICAGLAMRNPSTIAKGSAFAIFFWDLIGPDNFTRPDATSFLNGVLALLLGIGIGTLVFSLLFPPNDYAAQRRMKRAMRDSLKKIGAAPRFISIEAWISQSADRISRLLITETSAASPEAHQDLRGMLAVLNLGSAALELAQFTDHPQPDVRLAVRNMLRTLAVFEPVMLIETTTAGAGQILAASEAARAAEKDRLLHAAALMQAMAMTTEANAAFLR